MIMSQQELEAQMLGALQEKGGRLPQSEFFAAAPSDADPKQIFAAQKALQDGGLIVVDQRPQKTIITLPPKVQPEAK